MVLAAITHEIKALCLLPVLVSVLAAVTHKIKDLAWCGWLPYNPNAEHVLLLGEISVDSCLGWHVIEFCHDHYKAV